MIFDQGAGDLFVVRVAGNVASSTQIGSIEFAVSMFESPLVIIGTFWLWCITSQFKFHEKPKPKTNKTY